MSRPRTRWRDARVAFARVVAADDHTPVEALRTLIDTALVPGTVIERYGREWRMGQFKRYEHAVVGRIGYQRAGDLAELWDDQVNDFREQRLIEGLTSPFALNLENLAVVFQLRSGRIKHTSFIEAFRALLNEASGASLWRVEPIVQGVDWERWRTSVVRVSHLELRVERPNPNYHGRQEIQRIVEGTNARLARVVLESRKEELEGLNIDDPLIREAIDHALENYGSVKAVGDIPTPAGTQESVWRSDVEGAPLETRARVDPETREVEADALLEELPVGDSNRVDTDLRDELVAPPEPDENE